jgi:hypothetical protein
MALSGARDLVSYEGRHGSRVIVLSTPLAQGCTPDTPPQRGRYGRRPCAAALGVMQTLTADLFP